MYAPSSLSCTIPRFEAALEGEPPSSRCPHCLEPVSGEVFEHAHQPRMVPALAAEGGGGVEQLLGRRRVGQGEAEGARALEGKVQILLVQFDAEAGVEGAFDHPLAMDLENARGCEP